MTWIRRRIPRAAAEARITWSKFVQQVRRFGGYLFTGLLAVLPLLITFGVLIWVFRLLEGMLGPNTVLGRGLALVGLPFTEEDPWAYVMGWAVIVTAIFVLGVYLDVSGKKMLQAKVDAMLRKTPFVGRLYGTARQMVDMLDTHAETEIKRMSAVYCRFGDGAMFLALMPTPEQFHIGDKDYNAVLIPTAPVPFGGALLFVPAESVTQAEMSVDVFMSLYVSMGVSGPDYLEVREPVENERKRETDGERKQDTSSEE